MGLSRQPRIVCNRHFGSLGTELPRLQGNLNMNKRAVPPDGAGNAMPETAADENARVNVPGRNPECQAQHKVLGSTDQLSPKGVCAPGPMGQDKIMLRPSLQQPGSSWGEICPSAGKKNNTSP